MIFRVALSLYKLLSATRGDHYTARTLDGHGRTKNLSRLLVQRYNPQKIGHTHLLPLVDVFLLSECQHSRVSLGSMRQGGWNRNMLFKYY